MSNPDLMPGWRRALRSFTEASYKPGDILTFEWLDAELGVSRPDNEVAQTGKERLKWLKQWSEFRQRLLDDYQFALWISEDPPGYKVLTAVEQLKLAKDEGRRRVKVALRWQMDMLVNTDVSSLPDKERAEHAEAMARLTRIRSFARNEMKALPKPKDEL